jgi:hypothetical protein
MGCSVTNSYSLSVSDCAGLPSLQNQALFFKILPTLGREVRIVSASEVRVRVIDNLGRTVKEVTVDGETLISDLQPGFYYFIVNKEEQRETRRVLITE